MKDKEITYKEKLRQLLIGLEANEIDEFLEVDDPEAFLFYGEIIAKYIKKYKQTLKL